MPGVVFLIVVPTANFEQDILNVDNNDHFVHHHNQPTPTSFIANNDGARANTNNDNLNINLAEHNAVLRLEVELRDKNVRRRPNQQRNRAMAGTTAGPMTTNTGAIGKHLPFSHHPNANPNNYFVPMEKVLEELLLKLEIEHVTWSGDKKGYYFTIIFPLQAGDPCETTLHCLTELGIGLKPGSSVSVIPCSVTFDAIKENIYEEEVSDGEEYSKWNNFVDSIKSKLTVKQVVDGVRAGGALSFDYLLLIVTADSLAALGLVENNAPNITAAMLVSPLMGPVMSITFGAIISDRELMKSGFISLSVGMLISLIFGFIFGLILGTTEMPWGFNDWPTEEMKGRGNARSLWMGVAWALTSGSGVAIALLSGSAGPLIGVAISASLLPPVVNCGLYWALACIWLIYDDIKMPHMKGEPFKGNTSYVPIYTNYVPTEFLISGIVSGMLTVVNVICIFITAIIVLKIKEVAAPYTSSPDLRRFWETDIRTVRESNKSTIRRKTPKDGDNKQSTYDNIIRNAAKDKNLETALEQALKEAANDETFRKVKRMSYSGNAADGITQRLGISTNGASNESAIRNSKISTDLTVLDKLVSSLLERHKESTSNQNGTKGSSALNRLKSLSFRHRRPTVVETNPTDANDGDINKAISSNAMPTILEGNTNNNTSKINSLSLDRRNTNRTSGVRQIIDTIKNAPHRFSHGGGSMDRLLDENTTLTQNVLD